MNGYPKSWFSLERAASLNTVPKGAKIHIIGVAGVAMAQIAAALLEAGYPVSGSDQDFYEPMGSFLQGAGVSTIRGYDRKNIPDDASLIVIGNAIRYENPEVLEVEKRSLPYTLFPKLLSEIVIGNAHSIVVSGTHGKSSTTAFIASILKDLGKDPGYFIGGAVRGFKTALKIGGGDFSVVEGDEYDSAFFAKLPKFHFYRPKTLIVTSIEYDHADIYPSIEAINIEFGKLVKSMPEDGVIICNMGGKNIIDCIQEWRSFSKCPIITYGVKNADVSIIKRETEGDLQKISVSSKIVGDFSFHTTLIGEMNALNCTASMTALAYRGIPIEDLKKASPSFLGVKRRQEERWRGAGGILIEDFAHHPTAVRETLKGLKERFPGKELIIAFEPRSNTSRKKIFQGDYCKAFIGAARVVLPTVEMRHNDLASDLLDIKDLSSSLKLSGIESMVGASTEEIISMLLDGHGKRERVYVVMSNGSFGGLIDKLVERFRSI